MEQLSAALSFILERFQAEADPDPAVILPVALGVVALTAIPRVWRVIRQAATIIHEMGHVVAAVCAGRRVSGIRLHSDTSGVTVSRGRAQGPGLLITMLAGYPAPGLLAVGMAALAMAGQAGIALTVYQVILLAALLLSRNVIGIVSTLLAVGLTGVVWWYNEPDIVVSVVVALSVFYAIAGLRSTGDLVRLHTGGRRRGSSAAATDAAQAARAWPALPLPAWCWLGFFLLVGAGCAAAVGWLLFA